MGKTACLLMLFSAVFLMGAEAENPGQDELAALRNQQSALRTRIEVLKHEQDYLLFRQAMYLSDSKYLVMNITARKGQLNYKNRILKEFKFRLSRNFGSGSIPSGMVVLTKKTEGKKDRKTLLFGSSFLMQGKGTAVPRMAEDVAVISVTRKDISPIYYALEVGAAAYLEK